MVTTIRKKRKWLNIIVGGTKQQRHTQDGAKWKRLAGQHISQNEEVLSLVQ